MAVYYGDFLFSIIKSVLTDFPLCGAKEQSTATF